MSSLLDHRVRELAHSRPRLRPDLRFVLQEFQGEPSYLMEDPIKRRFFRVGLREYAFLQRLDGSLPVGRIVAQLAAISRKDAFTEQEAAAVIRWLADTELLIHVDSAHSQRLFEHLNVQRQSQQFLQKSSSLLFLKKALGNPDRLLSGLLPWLSWTLSPYFFLVWLGTLVAGTLAVGQHWNRFATEAQSLITGNEVLVSILVWVVLKAVHELWHGLACKRFGVPVPEAGVMLLLFVTPLAYVDATSSLRLRSRSQRLVVSAAGMYIELLLAAVMALVWVQVEPGFLSTCAHRAVLLGSVTTLLFNANPLMRFDGYYLLSDILGIPNLFSKGQLCTKFLLQRYLLGMDKAEKPLDDHEHFSFIACYGVAAGVWRMIVFFSIVLAAAFLLKGVGLLVAIVVCASALWSNIRSTFGVLRSAANASHVGIWNVLKRPALLGLVALAVLFGWQIRESATAPAVIEYDKVSFVRTECPGFVRSVHVQSGQAVKEGDLLLELDNPAQTAELALLRTELGRSLIRMEILFREENLAGFQAEAENGSALRSRINEMEAYVATLQVRAPRDGRVESRQLANLPGSYLHVGEEILTVAAVGSFKLTAAIPQDRIELFRENPNQTIEFLLGGREGRLTATMDKLEAAATRDIPHPALAASAGGPLSVEIRPDRKRNEAPGPQAGTNFRLLKPHFKATLTVVSLGSPPFHEGELASIKIQSASRRSLALLCEEFFARLLGKKLDVLRQNSTT